MADASPPPAADPLSIDLADFDAVGLLTEAIVSLRAHVLINELETAAVVSAPEGWHRLVINAKSGGSSVLVIRFNELSVSRTKNVATALNKRGWQLDEDREGATLRQAPGTTATDVAFEVLAALTVVGAPHDVRLMHATDSTGAFVELRS
jgi:hypothetical protein